MEECDANTSQIGTLFKACDLDGSGFIDEQELASICPDLSPEEISDVFKELDVDGDGQISIAEFSDGFKGISATLLSKTRYSLFCIHRINYESNFQLPFVGINS